MRLAYSKHDTVVLNCSVQKLNMLQEVSMNPPSVELVATLPLQVSGSNDSDSDSLSDHNDDTLGTKSSKKMLQIDTPYMYTTCSCPCCTNLDTPCQPMAFEKSKTAQRQQQKSHSRSIQVSWYAKQASISVCTLPYKVFCHTCCNARRQSLVTSSKHYKITFTEGGLSNWKKALQWFAKHEKFKCTGKQLRRSLLKPPK